MSVFEDLRRYSAVAKRNRRQGDLLLSGTQMAILICASVGAVAAVVGLFVLNDLKWGALLNDPATQFDLPVYAGLFTYLSVMRGSGWRWRSSP